MRNRFTRIGRNTDGSMSIEFGLVAPMLIMILIGIMEFSMIMFLNAVLEGNIRDAARYGASGSVIPGKTREQVVIEKIAESTMGLVAVNADNVTTLVYDSFTNVGQSEPYTDDNPANGKFDAGESYTDVNANGQWDADMGVPGLGDACDIVVYRVNAEWPLMLGLLASAIGDTFQIQASAAVRNEPYNSQPC